MLLNEIGDSADVERALVKEPQGGEAAPLGSWVELENGCICCSAKNGGGQACVAARTRCLLGSSEHKLPTWPLVCRQAHPEVVFDIAI